MESSSKGSSGHMGPPNSPAGLGFSNQRNPHGSPRRMLSLCVKDDIGSRVSLFSGKYRKMMVSIAASGIVV